MKTVAIIPARMAASRFPGKPMADINGMPMIGHCYLRALMCNLLDDVYVATCDQIIHDYITSINGKSVMTSDSHERACDRATEAMLKIEEEHNERIDILAMLQGDEPMVTSKIIGEAIKPLIENENINITNLYKEINSVNEFESPNAVKVVIDKNSDAIYFSREPIPSRRQGVTNVPMFQQMGIINFRRDYLIKFNEMKPTELEKIESVDMNRIIACAQKIRMVYSEDESFSVDTEEDLNNIIEIMKDDPLVQSYLIPNK
ncbi:3-deoxy-manno-octulosonate cytidylyltransferase [Verrucomicrobia bacterium]|nr:3-deoxy-manno-octulosonate cytidylyltransferase [Verrucomicrobiota bacterium]